MSAAEATVPRFTRAQVGAVLAPLSMIALSLAPLPLTGEARRLLPVVAGVLIAWVTEVVPIAVSALLIAPAMVLAGVCDAREAFAPYADPILYIFVGGFMIAEAMRTHGLDRRIALWVLSLGPVGRSASRTRAAMMLTGAVLSMWISNTATAAILLPILIGMLPREDHDDLPARRSASGSILALAYASSVGGLGTPVGSPPNLITMRMLEGAGIKLDFLGWMKIGVPVTLALSLVIFAYLELGQPAPHRAGSGAVPRRLERPLTRAEKVTALSFSLAALGWMGPGLANALGLSFADRLDAHLPAGGVALLAASVLFMVPREPGLRERVLSWREAATIDWGLIALFGGGLSLGKQMFDSGLADFLGRRFIELSGVTELWTLVALVTLFTLFFTEMCSNTATANMLVPLVIGVCKQLELSPLAPALAVGLTSSCAFMLPVATGPNAIAYATERVPLPSMIRAGAILNLLCGAVIVLLLWLLVPLLEPNP